MSQELVISQQLIQQYFGLAVDTAMQQYEEILSRLEKQVQYLLNDDFQTLLNALYRIDVNEERFREALELSKPNEVARNLGKLILDRIVLKAQTRLKYSS
mgnify:CR=1 FL=1